MQRVQSIPPQGGTAPARREFEVTLVCTDATHALLQGAGQLDVSSIDALTAVLETLLAWGRRHVWLDLGGVTVLGQPSLQAVVRVYEMYLAERGLLVLTSVGAELSRLLQEHEIERALFITDQPNMREPDEQCVDLRPWGVRSEP